MFSAVEELYKNLVFVFEDGRRLNRETKMKYFTLVKMLIYVYAELVKCIHHKLEAMRKETRRLKKNKSREQPEEDELPGFDKKSILSKLNMIIQLNISVLWNSNPDERQLAKYVPVKYNETKAKK